MMAKSFSRLLVALTAGIAATIAHAAEPVAPAGLAVFDKQCAACHQAGGKGMPGLAPALAGTLAAAVASDDGRRYLAQVLIHGLSGRIVSQGQTFNGAMPGQFALSDAELADVANYLARDLNGAASPVFGPEDFVRARAPKPSHKELRELRERLPK